MTKINDMDLSQRPREKLIKYGNEGISERELLAILINTGTSGKSSLDLADEIFSRFSYEDLLDITVEELCQINGIKEAKAAKIVAAFQLGKIINQRVNERQNVHISSSKDIYNFFKEEAEKLRREHFYTVLLNSKNDIITYELVSIGDVNSSIANPREVFLPAVRRSAKFVILVHNHPSGDPTPSAGDLSVTKRLVEAGRILDINVLDHVIIGKDRFYSFNDANRI